MQVGSRIVRTVTKMWARTSPTLIWPISARAGGRFFSFRSDRQRVCGICGSFICKIRDHNDTVKPFSSVRGASHFAGMTHQRHRGVSQKSPCGKYSSNSAGQNTIFALASGHGKCGVAVVRVSGPGVCRVIRDMISASCSSRIQARQSVLSSILDPESGETIDHGLVLWFPGPSSFTGEDVCELQVHGGPAVISALYMALGKLEGFRLAEAGEFSKRAFYNGKLDLTEVEGLGDLIHAETEAQRRQAVRQMSGDLSKLYEGWRQKLIRTVAHVEAYIDFSEDENIEEEVLEQARQQVVDLLSELSRHLADQRRGERLRSGVHVTIAGRPNVGKSTLLNALCRRPAAIVSPVAGTTRDVVESTLNIGGYPVVLSDTAGIRETTDEVEMEGVRRARERTGLADLIIFMVDGTVLFTRSEVHDILNQIYGQVEDSKLREQRTPATEERESIDSKDSLLDEYSGERELVVIVNKTDLLDVEARFKLASITGNSPTFFGRKKLDVLPVSCKTEDGMDVFLEWLTQKLAEMCSNPLSPDPYLTQERHRSHLTECALALQSFERQEDLVMAAEELRIALRQLGKITGHVTSEDVLDVIFKDFCIGK